MKALILLSHGSRRQESNDEMLQLAQAVAGIQGSPFARVVCAFQQFGRPDFKETLGQLVDQGVKEVIVFPLFLAAGSHVREDVPALMDEARAAYPGLQISVMPHLGQTSGMADFLLDQAVRHQS